MRLGNRGLEVEWTKKRFLVEWERVEFKKKNLKNLLVKKNIKEVFQV